MAKSKNEEEPEDEAVIMERMKQGLKHLLNTPPETHKQMVERRRKKEPKQATKRGSEGT